MLICPNCKKGELYSLYNTAGNFYDGIVECEYCGKTIATFNLVVDINE